MLIFELGCKNKEIFFSLDILFIGIIYGMVLSK